MAWIEWVTVNPNRSNLTSWLARPVPESVLQRFAEDDQAFDIRFLEDLLARVGEDTEILAHLGFLYTKAGRHRDALAVDRRLAALRPRDPIAFYNLACSHALLKQATRAFTALKKAIQLGYRDFEHIQLDVDLENLHKDPRWDALLSALKR
jgi:tetratricopeptide (TPR) repeat protein